MHDIPLNHYYKYSKHTLGDDVQKREILYKFQSICKITLRAIKFQAKRRDPATRSLIMRLNVFWVKDLDGEERETELDVHRYHRANVLNDLAIRPPDEHGSNCPQN